MGAGIAQVVAQADGVVTVLETDSERIDSGLHALTQFLDNGIRRGKLTEGGKTEILRRIRPTTELGDLADVDLVIEAVTESADVKKTLFARLAQVVHAHTVIVTNTSALSVSDLGTSVPDSGRFAGLHFFNPAQLMRTVEVVRALQTEDDVVGRLLSFTTQLGKSAVLVKDRPGFLVNWLLMPYLNDVVQAYDEELATAEDIDLAMKLGLGYKLGPLELLDLIGLDVHKHATQSAYDATLDPAFAPSPLLRTMVAAGMFGNKNGYGFRTH
jgi:3-hydroxybutyryl-CoA dehydrogenase